MEGEMVEHPVEPEEGDFVITPDNRVVVAGEYTLGSFREPEEAEELILEEMKKTNFYPNVWILSDHGNYHLTTLAGEASLPDKMLTTETARAGQRIEVWQHPNVQTVPYQGMRGKIASVLPTSKPGGKDATLVRLDELAEAVFIPIGHLISER